jgi:hypothetical protein
VLGDDFRVGRIRTADPDPHAPEVSTSQTRLQALDAVVSRGAAALSLTHLAERQVDLVMYRHHLIEVEPVLAPRGPDGASGLVHEGLGQQDRHAGHARPDAPLGQAPAVALLGLGELPAIGQQVCHLEADVVARGGVAGTRIPEPYEEEVDRSTRPPAAKQAQGSS